MDSNGFKSGKLSKQLKWAEADAKFLRKLSLNKNKTNEIASASSIFGFETNRSNDIINYSRQRYLRSYKFNDDIEEEKASHIDKAKKWFNLKPRAMSCNCNSIGKHSCNKGILKFLMCCRVD